MSDRNEILANFQAVSGIEDIAICLDILEQKNWDLTAAVTSVLPAESLPPPARYPPPPLQPRGHVPPASHSQPPPVHDRIDLTDSRFVSPLPSIPSSFYPSIPNMAYPGPSLPPSVNYSVPTVSSTECSLGVYYKNKVFSLQLPVTSTVAELKHRLKQLTGVPIHKQRISGWTDPPASDQVTLAELTGPGSSSGFHIRLEEIAEERAGPSQQCNEGNDVIDLERVINNAQSQRVGSSEEAAPDPPITVSSSPMTSMSEEEEEDGEDVYNDEAAAMDGLDFEDDTQLDTAHTSNSKAREPLIPEDCTDPTQALQNFSQRFELRYGAVHPLFYIGSLADAVQEATGAGWRNSKPMLVYLHHDASILSNVFCSQLLCKESIVSYLTSNFITWAWDLSLPQHRKSLLDMISSCFGHMARASVDDIHSDQLPVILIVLKVKGSVAIRNIIQGETNIDLLMVSLMTAMEEHQIQRDSERKEEEERLARERMIAEQNQAFQESLQADQEKMKLKEAQMRAEEEEKREKEAIRQSMASLVPEEPVLSCAEPLSTLRIRLPNGTTIQRRFLARHTLQDLLNYFGSLDYLPEEFKVLTSFPRKDLTTQDPNTTLEKAKLCPQETLFIEER